MPARTPVAPLNLQDWIRDHRELLRPPVGNKLVFPAGDFIVMVVGGPNARKDYHVDAGAEFFHQIEGTLELRTVQDGARVDYRVGPGEVFLLPPEVPHCPVRPAGSRRWRTSGSPSQTTVVAGTTVSHRATRRAVQRSSRLERSSESGAP